MNVYHHAFFFTRKQKKSVLFHVACMLQSYEETNKKRPNLGYTDSDDDHRQEKGN